MTEGIIDALAIARAEFERRLSAITDDDWGRRAVKLGDLVDTDRLGSTGRPTPRANSR